MRAHLARFAFILSIVCLVFGCGGSGGTGGSGSGTQNPMPTISSIAPNTATAGGATFTLTVTGAGFISSSTVDWNGSPLITTFVSNTKLQAAVPAASLATAGAASVTVVNLAPGGGTSSATVFTTNNPDPTVTALSPAFATAGGPAFTLTVTGTSFVASSQVAWNGSPLATTFVSSTSLTAQIPASDIASNGTPSVTVINPAPGGGTSAALTFAVNSVTTNLAVLDLMGNDLIWDPTQQKIYVSVPSAAPSNGNTITIVDPIAGKIVSSQATTSEPSVLSITDDGQFLYAILKPEAAVERYKLPSITPDIELTFASDPVYGTNYSPLDVKAQPEHAHTVAVVRANAQTGFPDGIGIFDDTVMRPSTGTGLAECLCSLQWKPDGSAIYAEDTGSSDLQFTSVSVDSTGATTETIYGGAFRKGGRHLHYDAQTNYVYTDGGENLNPSTGVPVGNYPIGLSIYGTTLTAIDSTLKVVFALIPGQDSTGRSGFFLQAYDQAQFNLLRSFFIPDTISIPQNFIRWGNSGLAFVTQGLPGPSSTPSKLYLLDGLFVNPAGPVDSASGTPLNPQPTLFSISPLSTTIGSTSAAVALTGVDFLPQATVTWNGTVIPSTIISSTEIQAQIPTSLLATSGQGSLAVVNPTPGGGLSNSLVFAVNSAPPTGTQIDAYNAGGNDLVWDSQQMKLYVSSPGIQGELGNRIVVVDPIAGTTTSTPFLGSDPYQLALSSDNQFLYVSLNGQNSIQRLALPDFAPDIHWNLGSDSFHGPYFAMGLAAAPSAPHTVAVNFGNFPGSSSYGIVIFDDVAPRPLFAPGWSSTANSYASIVWGNNASTMYADAQSAPTDLYVLSVNANGIQISTDYSRILNLPGNNFDIRYDIGTGLLYDDVGEIIDPASGTVLGSFGASGIPVPDSSLNQVFILGQTSSQTNTSNFTIQSFDQKTFQLLSSLTIPNVVGTPTAFIRWGTSGLAFTTIVGDPLFSMNLGPGYLYVVSGGFVKPSSAAKSAAMSPLTEHVRLTWGAASPNSRPARHSLAPQP